MDFLKEEWLETNHAFACADPEELIDGHIDICVIAIGTLLAFGVDVEKAWNAVHKANMAKEVGVKKERPNSFVMRFLIYSKTNLESRNLAIQKREQNPEN